MKVVLIVGFFLASCRQSETFCGDRILNAKLARSALQAAEYIRKKLVDEKVYLTNHTRFATISSLRHVGYTIDMISELGIEKYVDELNDPNTSTGKLGYYVEGIQGSCKDPTNYHGHNLIQRIKSGLPEYGKPGFSHPFPYALAVLAMCNSGHGQDMYANYTEKLINMVMNRTTAFTHGGDTITLTVFALKCMLDGCPKSCTYKAAIHKAFVQAKQWLLDKQVKSKLGNVGNSITTARVVQALVLLGVSTKDFRCEDAMRFILSKQEKDSSFQSYVMSTRHIIPILIGAVPSDLPHLPCPKNETEKRVKIDTCIALEFHTSVPNCTLPKNCNDPRDCSVPKAPRPVYFRRDDINAVYNGTNTHTLLKMAAKRDPCYTFKAVKYSYGHSMRAIRGVPRDSPNKKYWMISLRKINGPWDGSADVGAKFGIDTLRPDDGWCVVFKYRKLNFR